MSDIWFGDYKVHIQQNVTKMTNNVYLVRHERDANVFVKGDSTAVRVALGEQIDEKDLVFADMSDDQLAAFAEALASKGIKTNKDSIAEGKLLATERHLEDMRTIVLAKYLKPKEEQAQ